MDLAVADFEVLRAYVRRVVGIELGDDKQYLVRQRLEPVAQAYGCTTFSALASLVAAYPPAHLRDEVIEAMTTNETSFFRDTHPFEAFRSHVLPLLGEVVAARRRFPGDRGLARANIMSAGASTGQEAYSIAMSVEEYCRLGDVSGLRADEVSILALDVSQRVLARVSAGEYTALEVARGLTPLQRDRFFQQRGQSWVIRDELRRMVQCRALNFAEPMPFLGNFDVVFCRNILIYFDAEMKRNILRRFYDLLHPGGFLVLGSTETVYGLVDCYETLHVGGTILYRRK